MRLRAATWLLQAWTSPFNHILHVGHSGFITQVLDLLQVEPSLCRLRNCELRSVLVQPNAVVLPLDEHQADVISPEKHNKE